MLYHSCDNGGISIYHHHDMKEIENADFTLCSNGTTHISKSFSYNTTRQYMYVRFHTNAKVNAENMRGFSRIE